MERLNALSPPAIVDAPITTLGRCASVCDAGACIKGVWVTCILPGLKREVSQSAPGCPVLQRSMAGMSSHGFPAPVTVGCPSLCRAHPLCPLSLRRWERRGFWRQALLNQAILLGYWLGVDVHTLARWYGSK